MEFIKKSLSALSTDSIKKHNIVHIFYSIQYANRFREYHEPEQFNLVQSKDKINFKSITLKRIKEIIPKYKFCCCYSKNCLCDFFVRYKSHDSNGIYPWVWCDLVSDQDTVTPYNSIIILKILVFVNFSLSNYEAKTVNMCMPYETDEKEHIDSSNSKNQNNIFQAFAPTTFDNLDDSNFINIANDEQTKFPSNIKSFTSQKALESKNLESSNNKKSDSFGYEDLVEEISRWSRKPDGSYKDIRVLLSSLQQVLWENAQWEPIEFSKLMSDIELVKKVYRKAIILCHPDKHHKESEKHKSRAHLIFMAINESNNK
ncbi:DnaJ domain protein [Cryptosporidium meleagridis]|uniref:DnaJ domain protein n=1 Tax=Cryptosporidium meleagridis TaxID=93969 RepID=A0A2P4Z488_9CRYT|nr:DnaJ domain protein [Cryptosporidium meleagridis]